MTPSDLTGLPDNILRKMVEEARAEAARQALLVRRYEPAYLGLPHVVRERDEARAEAERLTKYHRTDGFRLALQDLDYREREVQQMRAEVARLRKWIKWCADIHEPCSAPGDFCLHCDAHAALRGER